MNKLDSIKVSIRRTFRPSGEDQKEVDAIIAHLRTNRSLR